MILTRRARTILTVYSVVRSTAFDADPETVAYRCLIVRDNNSITWAVLAGLSLEITQRGSP